jgi:hypothetical protein
MGTAHMFAAPFAHQVLLLPYRICTIPEIATIGQTEVQSTARQRFGLKQVLPDTRNSRKQRWWRY